ncbi:hypothetical protein BGZ81_005440, partial [Podila clonocystis]
RVLRDWDLFDSVLGVSTDAAPVIPKTVKLLTGTRPLIHIQCIAHALHNSIKTALASKQVLVNIIDKCHHLAMFFHDSPKMTQALHREQVEWAPSTTPLAVKLD